MKHKAIASLSSEDRFEIAESFKSKGDWEQAINNYLLAIEGNPDRENYYYNLAEVLVKLDRLDEAIDCLLKTIEINSNWFKPYYELGLIFEQKQQLNRAVISYQQSIKYNANYARAYSHLGDIFNRQGDGNTAAEYYQQAIQIQPVEKSLWLYLKWGDILLKQGKIEQAIECYHQSNDLDSSFIAPKIRLGNGYLKQGDYQRAIAIFKTAIELDHCNHQAFLGLAQALWNKGERQTAIATYHQALKIKPNDAQTYQELQLSLVKESLVEVVELEIYFRALDSAVTDPKVYYNLGKKLIKKGLIELGVECYLQAITNDPYFLPAYQDLRSAKADLDDWEKAIAVYNQIIHQDPQCLVALKNLAYALSQQGKIQQAIALQQQAIYQQTKQHNSRLVHKYWSAEAIPQPDFIIIGAEKCGTDSLYHYITQHQQVIPSLESGVHFFTYNFHKGLDWYLAHFPRFDDRSKYITGEVSNSYLSCEQHTPQKLLELFPKSKLLVLLRNPVERSISHYQQLVSLGRESRSFAEVVELEIAALQHIEDIWSLKQQYWQIGNGTIWHSLYVYFLQNWLTFFERQQLLIILSSDLLNNPSETMNQVFEFLEVSSHQLHEYPVVDRDCIDEDITISVPRELQEFFAPHNRQLEALLERKFDW